MIAEDLLDLTVPIDSIEPHPENPRVGAVDVIKGSLKALGQFRPIVVHAETNRILAGNHTWKAAKELGWREIAVTKVSCSEEAARRIMAADNRTAELGSYDESLLAELLAGLPTLEGTGYSQYNLEQLIAKVEERPPPEAQDLLALWGVIVEVGSEREQADLIDRLGQEGYRVRALMA